jgi:multidrug efflux pump
MSFTDIFIRRPVLAMVVSLMILVLGLKSLTSLPVLQYPRTQNAIVTVSTTYAGADPDIIAGFITTPLENAISGQRHRRHDIDEPVGHLDDHG